MVEEFVVKENLTKEMIDEGNKLTSLLDKSKLVVSASMWQYLTESNIWRLIIASPDVRKNGPMKVYNLIQSVLSKTPDNKINLALKDITVVETKDPTLNLLRKAVKTGKGISGIRFSKNYINGHFIDDTYVYRLN